MQIVLANQKGLNPEEPEVGSAALSESLYNLAVSLCYGSHLPQCTSVLLVSDGEPGHGHKR